MDDNISSTIANLTMNGSCKRHDYLSWDQYFMSVAFLSALRSKDPATQVGACIVNNANKIIGIGYNGMPNNIPDDQIPWGKSSSNPLENKYLYVCHAELNAVLNLNGSTSSKCTMYTTLFPCNECAKVIIQSGIEEIVYYHDEKVGSLSNQASKFMLDKVGVKIRKYELVGRKIDLNL